MARSEGKKPVYWQVWVMVAMLSTVIVAGFLLFPHTQEQRDRILKKLGTTNHGEFVTPAVSIKEIELKDAEGQPWLFDQQKVRWRMIIPGGASCEQQCRDLLYLTRQVHISLGKYSRRFERYYLNFDDHVDGETIEYLKLHPFLHTIQGDREAFSQLLSGTNTPLNTDEARAYLVDQNGMVMMSYTLANKGHDIIEDIEHLMKYSPAG